ncbi:hypothetical protein GSI_00191 [Ganoderma sinense ZZ0214-1]|uniref:DUF6534 domain-containing protein n=1 Tax=Ganoderma sinense ZZ0214-1 TaxID=1077348 RepID=A0A2G8SRY1_9APHY|nr:hypothetical protein GSI_00191 [Ganoderma sinense ZZ0214-1]
MSNSTPVPNSLSPEELAKWLPLDKTFGAYLLGTFLGLILYGLIIHQACRYYRTFQSDDSFIRLLVTVVLALETLHTALTMYLWYSSFYPWSAWRVIERRPSYNVLITCFGKLDYALASGGPWSLNIQPVLNSVTALSAQLFFARRVYEMGSRSRFAAVSAILILIVGFGFAIATSYQAFATTLTLSTSDIGWLLSAPVGLSFIADSVLTITLLSAFRRSRSELVQTNTVLELIVIFVVNTGQDYFIGNAKDREGMEPVLDSRLLASLPSIFNALGLSFTIGDYNRSTLLVLFFGTISTRVYANTFLSVLNSRDALASAGKRGLEVVSDGSGSYAGLGLIARAHRQAAAETWNVPQPPEPEQTINVQITTELEEWEKHERRRDSESV